MNILHVDDEPDIREIVKLALEMGGDTIVDSVPSGEAALDRIAAAAPDLVLLDVMMPGMSGPELKTRMNGCAAMRRIPVIFMTAAARAETKAELMALDARGVLEKPFDPMALSADVHAMMG